MVKLKKEIYNEIKKKIDEINNRDEFSKTAWNIFEKISQDITELSVQHNHREQLIGVRVFYDDIHKAIWIVQDIDVFIEYQKKERGYIVKHKTRNIKEQAIIQVFCALFNSNKTTEICVDNDYHGYHRHLAYIELEKCYIAFEFHKSINGNID